MVMQEESVASQHKNMNTTHKKMPRVVLLSLLIVALIIGSIVFNSISRSEKAKEKAAIGKQAAPVTVAKAIQKDVPLEIKVIGNVEPILTVQVKAQATGQLTQVYFKEGQYVKKGDPLFLIDPRQYEAQVEQARANVARDKAQIRQALAAVKKDRATLISAQATLSRDQAQSNFAQEQSQRYHYLAEQGAVSFEQSDQMNTNKKYQAATVQSDLAAIENAKANIELDESAVQNAQAVAKADEAILSNALIQLGYCHIKAPIDGRTGSLQNHVGDMIKANDTAPLVIINQVSPIYVSFSVPEHELDAIRKYHSSDELKVQVEIQGRKSDILSGKLSFVDNTVDTTTGTIRLKAEFINEAHKLWPGEYVNVCLYLTTEQNAIIVPSQAVQVGQRGQYVFIVDKDNKAQMRLVKVGRNIEGMTVIKEGISAGDTVITDGHLQVVPGNAVKIVSSEKNS